MKIFGLLFIPLSIIGNLLAAENEHPHNQAQKNRKSWQRFSSDSQEIDEGNLFCPPGEQKRAKERDKRVQKGWHHNERRKKKIDVGEEGLDAEKNRSTQDQSSKKAGNGANNSGVKNRK